MNCCGPSPMARGFSLLRSLGMSWRNAPRYSSAPFRGFHNPVNRQIQACFSSHTSHVGHLHPLREIHSISDNTDQKHDSPQDLFNLSLELSQTPMEGTAELRYTAFRADGSGPETARKTKTDIARDFGLKARDLRTIDLPTNRVCHVLIRDGLIVFHTFDLRLILLADQVLVFHNDGSVSTRPKNAMRLFIHDLENKVKPSSSPESPGKGPFELRVLEAALSAVTSSLEAEYLLTKKSVTEALETMDQENAFVQTKLRGILNLVRTLTRIEHRARQIRGTVQEVLNDDEDMANMYLTDKKAGKPHAIQDHQEVEYMFEAYFKSSDAIVQAATSLIGNIQQTEGTVQSILNVQRNQIMVLEAKIEIIMVGLATATLVAGLYGMNVINYLEETSWGFGFLAAVSALSTAVIWRYGLRRLRRIQRFHL